MLKALIQEKIYFRLASLILVVLLVCVAFNTETNRLSLAFFFPILQGLFSVSLGICVVFALNAEFPKRFQIIKKLARWSIILFIITSFVAFVDGITLNKIFNVYCSLYFLGSCYFWGRNKIKEGSYEKLLEYKKVTLYPAIIYLFFVSPIVYVLSSMYLTQ